MADMEVAKFEAPHGSTAEPTTSTDPLMGQVEGKSSNPFTSGSDQTTLENTFLKDLPEEYRDKPYLQDVNSMDAMLKKLDGAQSLIGKKTVGVPGEDSTPEEWTEHFKKLGAPESAEGYEFGEFEMPEGLELPEGMKLDDEESMAFMKETFKEANLTKAQADIIHKKHKERLAQSLADMHKSQTEKSAAMNEEFNNMAVDTFGEKTKEVLEATNDMIAKYGDPKFTEGLNDMSNKDLILMASVLNNFKKANMGEDSQTSGGTVQGRASGEELRQKARELMKSNEYNDTGSSMHKSVVDRINKLYKEAHTRDKGHS